MKIQVKICLDDEEETELATVWMRCAPRIGEVLWLVGLAQVRARTRHGASAFRVKDVAHWVGEENPIDPAFPPFHNACVYVEIQK